MARTTLRTRTTVLATVITGLTLLAGSVALVLTLESQLTAGSDALARSRVTDLLELAQAGELPTRLTNIDEEGVAQVVAADGRVLAASPNVAGQPRISAFDPGQGLAVHMVDAPDDDETERYRLWAGTAETPQGLVTAYVGSSLESVREASGTLRTALAIGVPLVVALLGLATWLVLGGALRRVDRIRIEVDEITGDRLDRRVPETGTDDEVGRLAVTMNRMLARLEVASRRQQAFVADASHDLQSPLAAQRTQLEVARAHPDRADLEQLTADLLDITGEMEHLVRDLLFLAATDAGAPKAPATELDLDDVVLEEVARARPANEVHIDTSGVSAAATTANRAEVQRLVRNLLDNAVAHAESTVRLRVRSTPEGVLLDVEDDGPGVPPEEQEPIFDRFHRGDSARSRHRGGSGLGLPIARDLAERNGGHLELVPSENGAHFRLRLRSGG